jgi:hypothetical protein
MRDDPIALEIALAMVSATDCTSEDKPNGLSPSGARRKTDNFEDGLERVIGIEPTTFSLGS